MNKPFNYDGKGNTNLSHLPHINENIVHAMSRKSFTPAARNSLKYEEGM